MDGFLEGKGGGGRGFLEGAAPAASASIGGAVNIPGLDEILSAEGAQHVAPVMRAILSQESGGNPNIGNSIDGARGIAQVMPGTFKMFAKPGERIDNPADNLRVAARLLSDLHKRSGGDPGKMAAGYFSGAGNIGTDSPYKVDHADGNGKRVSSYVSDVLARMSAAPAEQPAAPQGEQSAAPSAPGTWPEMSKRKEYLAMTPAERELSRSEYFNRFVAPKIPQAERVAMKKFFMEQAAGMDPKEPGFAEKIEQGLKTARNALFGNPDGVMASAEVTPDGKTRIERTGSPVNDEYYSRTVAKFNASSAADREKMASLRTAEGAIARNLLGQRADIETGENQGAKIALAAAERESDERTADRIKTAQRVQFAQENPKLAALGSGAAHILQGTFDAVPLTVDAFNTYAIDPFLKAAGAEPMPQAARLPGAAYFERLGNEYTPDIAKKGMVGAWNRDMFMDWAMVQFAQQTPQMVQLVAAAFMPSMATPYLTSMGAQAGGQAYQQNKSEGFAKDKAVYDALTKGSIEILTEMLPLGVFNKVQDWVGTLPLKKQGAFITNVVKRMATAGAGLTAQSVTEAIEEAAAAVGGNLSDRLILGKDTDLTHGVAEAAVIGGIMGGAMGGGHAARAALRPATHMTPEEQIAAEIEARANGVQFTDADARVRESFNPDPDAVDPATTRKTPAQVWRRRPATPDAHAAGLTPEQQQVDADTRAALADLLEEDEIPASTILGVEAGGDEAAITEPANPASMPVSEGSDIEGATTAAPAAEGKKTKLTPFVHPDLEDVEIRGELAYMADQAGWEQVGGKMIRKDGTDQTSDVTGRTPWIPKQPWYQMMPERLNEEQTIDAVGRALLGEPLTAKEKRVIGNMLDFAKASLEEQRKWHVDAMDAVGATSTAQYEQAGQDADTLEAMDADIPFDLNDPRLQAGNTLTDEELDGIFGKQQSGGVSEKPVAGAPHDGTQGTGQAQDAGPEVFQLESETPDQVRAREAEAEKAQAAERKTKADAEKKAKAEQDAKEQKRRIEESVDNFQLGESAERAVSGQVDIFDSPAAPKRDAVDDLTDVEALAILGMYRGGSTRDPNQARKYLKEDFKPEDIKSGLESLGKYAPFNPIPGAVYLDQHGQRTPPFPTSGKPEDAERWLRNVAEKASRERSRKTGDPSFISGISKEHPPSFGTPDFNMLVMTAFGKKGVNDGVSAPKTEKEAKEKREAETSNGIHKDVPNGQYGNVDHPMRFMSGLSRKGDFKVFAKGAHVGVSVGELSNATISGPQLGQAMTDANRYLFVDSGAYSLFQGIKRAKLKGVDTSALPTPLDFDVILDTYRILHQEIAKADDSGFATERVFFVMPDIIGDQVESLKLIHEYGPWIDEFGDNAIVPLQAGGLTLTEAYEVMMSYLNRNLTTDESPILGIPTSQMAASDAELTELLKAHGENIRGIHILGGVSDSKLQPRLDAIRAAGYTGNVSADGAAWRGPLAKPGTSRPDAIDQAIEKLYGKKEAVDLGAMFDELVEERRPKTEAKEVDLDAMFDELIAERQGTAKPKTEKQAKAKGGKWEDSPFADRIRAAIDSLNQAGQAEMANIIESGFASDAKHGQLTEEKVAFREEHARKTIAAATNAGKPIPYEPMTADGMIALDSAVGALPREIIDAAVAKWNQIAPLLAEKGFRFGDVDSRHPDGAQAIHRQLRDILQALMGLAPRRYQQAKGHKNANPDALERNESRASEVLGIDTRTIPGIDTSRQVTLSGGVREKAPAKPRKGAKERSTGKAAISAAKNTAEGFANALDGLAALFGGEDADAPIKKMHSGIYIKVDEETYRRAIPLFKQAVAHFGDAAADIREVMAAVIDGVAARIGLEKVVKMKPYVLRFVEDYQEGKINDPATGTDTQQDRQDDPAEISSGDAAVHGGPAGAGAAGAKHGKQAGGQRDAGTPAGLVVHDSRAPAGGEGRSDGVSEPRGEFDVGGRDSQSDDATGSGRNGKAGAAATDPRADGEVSTADGARDVKVFQTFEEKLEAQKKANAHLHVQVGNRKNIDATLPLLLEGQRDDVHFAETRLAKPDGYGVLFTNGTGTGKTYLALGIIHRLIRSGKPNGVVVVPNQEVMNEWLASAPNLGIELHVLEDKKDKGRGVSITTYANFGDNMHLLDRDHDWAVADEAHMLMANKDAKVTLALEIMRAVTHHPDSAYTRARMLHRDVYDKIQVLREQERKIMDAREKGMATPGSAETLTKIADELRPLLKEFDKAVSDQRALLAETKPQDRPRLVAVSATPFAWEKNVQWAEGYLFHYPQVRRTGAYNEPTPYQQYMITNFGYRMKNGKMNEPDEKVNRSLMQIEWNKRMRQAGVVSTRLLDVDYDYDRKFILVDGGIGARIDAAMEWLRKEKDGIYSRYHTIIQGQFDYLTQRRLLEAIKARAVVDIIKEHHALGRKVVVFHDYNQGGGFAPFNFPGNPDTIIEFQMGFGGSVRKVKYTHGEFVADFAAAFPDLVGDDLAKLKSPIETLREAFPGALFNNGLEKKKDALQAIKDFNNDDMPDANLLVVQSDKNAGWSGHDKTGKHMRVSINLGLATAPVKNIQLEGRTYRVGQRSDSPMRYLNTGTSFERYAFAVAISSRSETVENLAMGEFARTLKRSYIEAFGESDVYPAGAEDGKGGKDRDRRSVDLSDFDRAISYYFGQHKKNSRTKAQEGNDYYATPEPVGLKMVEWLEPKAGGDYLEPSAGHGAIARWFPQDANVKAIEQSPLLASRLALNMADPSGVINGTFEDHHIGNKYDGIAMNPPFNEPGSVGGKLAMEHLAKAFYHLKEGGRLVAIIPHGPAMDKRLNDWLTGTVTNTRGVESLNVPDARLDHVIELPNTTFLRAGTGVSTRIVIIDRIKGGNDGTGKARSTMPLDIGIKHGDINDLFQHIKNMTVPPRPTVAAAAVGMTVQQATAVDGVTMHAHGRVVDDAAKAVYRVVGNKLETDAPVEKITTKGGKELEGVFVPDRAMAKEVDPFTWKPQGKDGFFVRIKHVIRPKGETVFSRGNGQPVNSRIPSVSALMQMVHNHLHNFAAEIPVEVRESVAELGLTDPAGNPITSAKGLTFEGKIYLFRNGLTSMADARDTLFHELFHFGMRRFLTRDQYITTMSDLYRNDPRIRAMADAWIKSEEGDELRADNESEEYIQARGVDEAVAHFANRVNASESGFVDNTWTAKLLRTWIRVLARIHEWFGDKRKAEGYRGVTNDQARKLIKETFGRLRAGEAANPQGDHGGGPSFRRGESARSVNLSPKVAPKVGLLDTPMRLAFEKTGALAVWRGAFRLLEKTADRALSTKMGEIVKAGLIDRYGLSDAVIERHEEMRVKMIAGVRTAERFMERLKGLTRAESAVLYAAANNADRAAVDDMIKDLPEDSQEALHEIKELVRDLGQEAVDLKMLDADTFKANEYAYLHRSYRKYELDLTDSEKSNRATRIKGDQFKQRGLADVVSSDRLLKWMPDFWGTRVKNGAITPGTIGQVFIRLERRDDPRPTANLEGIEGTPALGRLKEVVYWPQGEEIPAKFGDWHVEGEWVVRRTVGKNVVFRRDFTKEERQKMGEIEDIRYAMAKTLNLAVHDVEVGKYFAWLAEGHARLPGDLPRGAEVIDNPRRAEAKLQAFTADVWVKVPDVKVAGTNVSAYGKLAGRYVPGPIWTDIRHVSNGAYYSSKFGQNYEKLLRLWKLSKTALSPAVHVNNVMANVVMADWHDIGGKHLLQAAAAWARQGKNADAKRIVEDFQDHGGELGTFALNEMQREQLAPILDELLAEVREANDLNGVVNAASVMSLLREGMVRQAASALGQSKVGRAAGAIPRKMIDVYQLEDQIFRLAAFIKARESGLNDREAGRYARKSFLDYDIQAPWVVAAKRSGLLPFVSFSYRAIPMLYATVRDKPWKVMKLALVLGAASAASAALLGLSDDDEDDERRWLPKEKQGTVLGLVPKLVRMPWNTASDNPVFLDVRRFIPVGDIADVGMSQGAVPLPPFLTVGGPLALMVEIMADKSLFTGKEINKASDSPVEAGVKVLDHIYKWAAPNIPIPTLGTVVPGVESNQFQTYAWTGIVRAAQREEGAFGRDQNVPMAIGSALGIKLEGYSKATGMRNAKAQLGQVQKELRMERAALAKQRAGGGLSDVDYAAKVRRNQEKTLEAQREFQERATK